MNGCALQHIMDSQYCFAVSGNEVCIRLRTAGGDIKEAYIFYESKYRIAHEQKKARMSKCYEGSIYDWYSIRLKLEDTRLAYVFYIYDGKEYKYFSEEGLADTYDFSMGYYSFFQFLRRPISNLIPANSPKTLCIR